LEQETKLEKASFSKLAFLAKYVFKYKVYFILGCISLIFSSTIVLAFPYVIGKLIDIATNKPNQYFVSIESTILILFIILLMQSVSSFLRVFFFAKVSERAMADIRISFYEKIVNLPISFFDKTRVGELVSRISTDVTLLQDTLSITLAELFRQISVLILGTILIFYNSPKLTIFMLAIFPIIVLFAIFFGKYIKRLSKETQSHLAQSTVAVEETLQSIQMVKIFNNEYFEIKKYKNLMDRQVKIALRSSIYRAFFISFIIFALFGAIVLVLWYGSTLVSRNEMTMGDLTSFVIYTTFIGASVGGLGEVYGQVLKSIGAASRIYDIMQEKEEDSNQATYSFQNGDIEFKNVNFRYPTREDVEVLKNFNLTIKKNKKTAIVGKSGAGKSTIVQLLMKFYKTTGGDITINGISIQKINLLELRKNISYIPQEVLLFGGTIRENIAYGKLNATDQEIINAAKYANALEFIEKLPDGLNTIVGERGTKLSGGQRQRIAIARAILKNAPILILDEATSALDNESEQYIQSALDYLSKDKTTIIIAHRLTTIQNADNIVLLDKQQIVEQGTHQSLMEQDGIYAKLYQQQKSQVFELSDNL
jgi:ABC-type multidrug transport system fused ATPase/permease subunit